MPCRVQTVWVLSAAEVGGTWPTPGQTSMHSRLGPPASSASRPTSNGRRSTLGGPWETNFSLGARTRAGGGVKHTVKRKLLMSQPSLAKPLDDPVRRREDVRSRAWPTEGAEDLADLAGHGSSLQSKSTDPHLGAASAYWRLGPPTNRVHVTGPKSSKYKTSVHLSVCARHPCARAMQKCFYISEATLWSSSHQIGTIQRSLAWPPRKDDAENSSRAHPTSSEYAMLGQPRDRCDLSWLGSTN